MDEDERQSVLRAGVEFYPPEGRAKSDTPDSPEEISTPETAGESGLRPVPFPTITLCVLGGFPRGARMSLMHSLRSWIEAGLMQAVNETIVFLQERMDSDLLAIPRETERFRKQVEGIDDDGDSPAFSGVEALRLRIMGASGNVGIGRAMWEVVHAARTRHVIFLEDDWVLPVTAVTWAPVITSALTLITRRLADVVRLKSDEHSPQVCPTPRYIYIYIYIYLRTVPKCLQHYAQVSPTLPQVCPTPLGVSSTANEGVQRSSSVCPGPARGVRKFSQPRFAATGLPRS